MALIDEAQMSFGASGVSAKILDSEPLPTDPTSERSERGSVSPVYEATRELASSEILLAFGFSEVEAKSAKSVFYFVHRKPDANSSTTVRQRLTRFDEESTPHFRLQYRSDDDYNLPDALVSRAGFAAANTDSSYAHSPEELAARLWETIDQPYFQIGYAADEDLAIVHLYPSAPLAPLAPLTPVAAYADQAAAKLETIDLPEQPGMS